MTNDYKTPQWRPRREFLRVGGLGALGLGLSGWLRARGQSAPVPLAKSCILIWLDGGPSHLDTFDPKPEAPAEIRSPFAAIPTVVPGLRVCEHLPLTARVMDRVALIRSLTHELGNHDTGSRFLLTGHRPNPSLHHPSLGSIVASKSVMGGALPPYIAIPGDGVGGGSNAAKSGFLGARFNSFNVGNDPSKVEDLKTPEMITVGRNEGRRQLLRRVDALSREVLNGGGVGERDAHLEQAYRLIYSREAVGAFDLDQEPVRSREAYGRGRVGMGCLLARRLVERGTRFVTVVDTGWDTHQHIARELPDARFAGSGKLPALDRAYAALIGDLADRGLLESTLVVLMGEFGRTPKLNSLGGRDHWPRAGFVCVAGGGVQGGRVIGATNAHGEIPTDRPVGPPDIGFTLLKLLGVDPGQQIVGPGGRPLRWMAEGSFISELV